MAPQELPIPNCARHTQSRKAIPYISLTSTKIKNFLDENVDSKQCTSLVAFTCGHGFTQTNFISSLAVFENGLSGQLPISAKVLLDRYRSNDLAGIACPNCVMASIKSLAVVKGVSTESK